MKKALIITLIVILSVLILLPLALFGLPMVYNNVILLGVSDDLRDAIKSTEGLELIEFDSICGNLNGNGNKMQFLAAALVKCSDEKLIKDCLKKAGYPDRDYARLTGKAINLRYLEHGKLDFDFTAYNYGDSVYVICISSQPSYASVFDIRAH